MAGMSAATPDVDADADPAPSENPPAVPMTASASAPLIVPCHARAEVATITTTAMIKCGKFCCMLLTPQSYTPGTTAPITPHNQITSDV